MEKSEKERIRALSALTMSMVIFGTIGVCRRFISLPSGVLACGRGIMGGVFLLIVLRIRGDRFNLGRIRKKDFALLIFTGVLIGINWILLFEAYNYTTVAVATLSYYMQPMIVMLLSPIVLKEKLTAKHLLCVILSMVGMVLVSGVIGGGSVGSFTGVALGLGAAVLYATVVLLNKKIDGIPVFEKTIIQLFSAATAMLPYLAATGTLHTYELSVLGTFLFLTVGIVHTGIAYALYFGSIEVLPAKTCALMSYIDPVTAVILSALLLKEPMGDAGIIGTVLIIGSAVYSEFGKDGDRDCDQVPGTEGNRKHAQPKGCNRLFLFLWSLCLLRYNDNVPRSGK